MPDPHADMVRDLLGGALSAAVPLWIDRIQSEEWSETEILQQAHEAAQIVAEKGDVLQFRSKKAGESAHAFNALARGLACLAHAPGGVTFLGQHWEA